MTDWKPIAELPEALKDGRQVLIWDYSGATVCTWRERYPVGWDSGASSECSGDPIIIEDATHFAEIEPVEARPDPWRDRKGFCNRCHHLLCQCAEPGAAS